MGRFPALLLLLALPAKHGVSGHRDPTRGYQGQGKNWNQGADSDTISFPTMKGDVANPTDDSSKDQRTLYALVVLSSFLPTTALVATVILLVTTYIRRKRAGEGTDSGRQPSFSQAALQKDGRNKANSMPEGELNDSTMYAVVRHQPQTKPGDVVYANIQPSPEVFFHAQESPGNSVSSGSVEYATVIFRPTTPHSGTEKRKPGPLKQSSKNPLAYPQDFAELCLEAIYL